MKGNAPIRRTLNYLNAGKLVLKDSVKIFSVNYNIFGEHHDGARNFVFWKLPQVQYRNPGVQVVTFKNLTPSPFIRCYFGELDNDSSEMPTRMCADAHRVSSSRLSFLQTMASRC